MKKDLFNEIEIPKEIEAELEGKELRIKGPEGENTRKFKTLRVKIEKKDNKIIVGCEKATKKEKRMMNTVSAHIRNMIKGVQKKFSYQVKICSSHFPMNVEIKDKEVIIKNFLGEKIPRKANIPENVEIAQQGEILTITSVNKEKAGQAAANIEKSTRLTLRDRRVFQDGAYIINKNGKEI